MVASARAMKGYGPLSSLQATVVSLKDRWAAVISVFDPNSIPTRSEKIFLTSIFAVWRSWVCEPFLSCFEIALGCRFGYWPNLAELL